MKGRDGASESDLHERTGHGDRIRPIESVACQKEAMEGRDVVTESKLSNLEAQEEKRTSRSKKGTTVMGKRSSDLAYNQGHACASGT